ncbi:uncharacterized protein PHALS_10621 [Plasmopara halstedii]|uniref:Uncharacterized protein n=1 Tax=Plasmopara halstedii TaxID=4781 RepID=A0A0P1AHH4_PLAHL|nr:uncharacterized protein PHALS_10621 [Plasmopara halstedii]CEG40421.1 hypothetical protein PHALS_10621 [Plasmopara halstedii]|eukprot:XP_024576790.1 hypothetical protein PHALS_10621 [Plasmopara halstedii]
MPFSKYDMQLEHFMSFVVLLEIYHGEVLVKGFRYARFMAALLKESSASITGVEVVQCGFGDTGRSCETHGFCGQVFMIDRADSFNLKLFSTQCLGSRVIDNDHNCYQSFTHKLRPRCVYTGRVAVTSVGSVLNHRRQLHTHMN